MKNRDTGTTTDVWRISNNKFAAVGVTANTYVMDNGVSRDLKIHEREKHSLPISTIHIHCTNLAEREMKTFKSYFMAGLTNCDCNIILVEYHSLLVTTCMMIPYSVKYGKIPIYKILCSKLFTGHVGIPRTRYVSLRYLI